MNVKIRIKQRIGSVLLGGVVGVTGWLPVVAEEGKKPTISEPEKPRESVSVSPKISVSTAGAAAGAVAGAKSGVDGNMSINVTVTGPDGKPITHQVGNVAHGAGGAKVDLQGSAIAVASDGVKQSVTVTTIGPDGKVHTVTSDGKDGKLPPIAVPTPDGRGMAMSFHRAPARMEKVTYAGVNVVETPEVVSRHLPIPKGMGLVVTEIVKGSPAQRAGIRKDDILLKFDDQLLASQDQLRKLTRSRKSGDKVRLTLMQDGKETSLEVILGEREEDVANPGHGPWQPLGWLKDGPHPVAENVREAAEKARDMASRKFEEAKRQIQERREKSGEVGRPGGEVVERMEREIKHLREEVERLRGQVGRGEGEGARRERPPGPPRDGERPPGVRRDGDRPPGAPRDGERPPGAPRDGERAPGAPRDGERAPGAPRDGERAPGAPRDGERR